VEREFTEFVTQRTHALLRAARALTGDPHEAEDLVQNALAKAFASWRRIRGDAEPYVRRIMYHDHISWWRRLRRRPETLVPVVPDRAEPADRAAGTELGPAVRAALLSLPPRQRAVLVLRFLEDLSTEQTGRVLGCRPGTVTSQTNRALAKIRELLPGAELVEVGEYLEGRS
jgi:RNA polymerase sigma-70 factor (sigma-E family)